MNTPLHVKRKCGVFARQRLSRRVAVSLAYVTLAGLTGCLEAEESDGANSPEHRAGQAHTAPRNRAGSRLKPTVLVGDDGSRNTYRWYDTELKEYCWYDDSLKIDSDGNRLLHCLPKRLVVTEGEYFEDEECSRPVDVAHYSSCEDVNEYHFVEFQSAECGVDLRMYKIAELKLATEEDKIWKKWSSVCQEVYRGGRNSFYYVTVQGSGSLDQFVAVTK